MRIGPLRHKISIEQVTVIRDERGEEAESWVEFKAARAAIYPKTGTETFDLHQENNDITHEIITRYQSGVTPKMRINFKGRYFDIEWIVNIAERNKTLKFGCVERL